ncbi:hypothetical protein F7U66_01690 [Vibrio parahaemolyticus]|nr:hypothetical protein [Vibrio parahaemolyticus]
MSIKLPLNTPKSIIAWVKDIEEIHPVNNLTTLPSDATIEAIKEAYHMDRSTLIGIGQTLLERAKYDAWPD